MENTLTAKELQFLDQKTKFDKVRKDINEQRLEDDYFTFKQNNRDFTIVDLITATDGVGEFAEDKYSQKEKDYLVKFHNGNQTALKVTSSTPDAIIELSDLQEKSLCR